MRARRVVLGVLGVLALGITTLALSSAYLGAGRSEAAGATPDLAMAIDVNGGGDDCDTKASTGSIGAMCTVSVGQQFTLKGSIDKVAGLPGTGGYLVFQFRFLYTNPGLTRNDRMGSMEVGSDTSAAGDSFWEPDVPCAPNTETDPGGNYYVDCWGPGAKSMYVGKLVEVDFTCATAGMRTITMDDAGTYVHNENHGNIPLDTEGNEVLTIDCSSAPAPTPVPVGGIAELPDVARAPLDAAGSSGSDAGLLAGIVSAAAAGSVVLGGGLWLARRRRQP